MIFKTLHKLNKGENIDDSLTQKLGEQEFRFNMDELFELEKDFENKSKNVAKNDNI